MTVYKTSVISGNFFLTESTPFHHDFREKVAFKPGKQNKRKQRRKKIKYLLFEASKNVSLFDSKESSLFTKKDINLILTEKHHFHRNNEYILQ